MDVGITELRAHLGEWLDHARSGHDVVVTDRGVPVAKLVGVESTDALVRLTASGLISRPAADIRPTARGRKRPSATGTTSGKANGNKAGSGTVAELVAEQRH